jgi:hypothetical protein
MNDRTTIAADDAGDDWLDAALREDGARHRADYLEDGGFTAGIMAKLPPPAMLPAWRKPVLAAIWGVAGLGAVLALPGTAPDLVHEIARVFLHPISTAQLVTGVSMLGIAAWAAAAFALKRE